jgi:hypothetical protein
MKMKMKTIKKVLGDKLNHFISHIKDEEIKKLLRNNIITGGAIASMFLGEDVIKKERYQH